MNWLQKNALYLIFGIAFSGTIGSLIFSEVLGFAPCALCWYQRIFLYPLVFILPVAIVKKDKLVSEYVLPLAFVGGLIAGYHSLLSWGVISENILPCTSGVSCSTKYFEFFGFVNIPFLSFVAFVLVIFLTLIYRKENLKNETRN